MRKYRADEMQKLKNKQTFERVIVDSRDGTKDYWITDVAAQHAFKSGKLAFCNTNDCYMEMKEAIHSL